jgi:hypothetical protein
MATNGLEAAWAELLRLAGDVVVARSRGAPADPPGGSTAGLVRRYRRARRALGPALETAGGTASTHAERDAIATIRSSLGWLDELEPVPGTAIAGSTSDEPDDVAALRRTVFGRYGRAAAAVRVDGERLDRLSVLARLAVEPDAGRRRALFEALDPVWRAVDGDGGEASPYRRLLSASAARWRRDGSPIEANAAALGIAPGALEPMLHSILAAWREAAGPDRLEPWDHWHACGAAARRLDPLLPPERLPALNDAHLASLGADPASLGIRYDVLPRPGRPVFPVAFTMPMGPEPDGRGGWRSRPPWVFATYAVGGLGNLVELVHESGHAVHFAAVTARPAHADFPVESAAFLEATADLLGWDADEPAWQAHHLGDAATAREAVLHRYGSVVLDVCWALFEIELHRRPARRPNDVWTEVTTEGLGLAPHPERSWWAMRGQLIDASGYLANYAMSAIVAAALRARVRALRGDHPTGDPGWYVTMTEVLFRWGSARRPADLLTDFLGGPVTADPLLADLRSASRPG